LTWGLRPPFNNLLIITMKIYTLTYGKYGDMKTFKSFADVLNHLEAVNEAHYDGRPFGIFGDSWGDEPYVIDSVVLRRVLGGKAQHTEFFIRCIDGDTGKIIELSREE